MSPWLLICLSLTLSRAGQSSAVQGLAVAISAAELDSAINQALFNPAASAFLVKAFLGLPLSPSLSALV